MTSPPGIGYSHSGPRTENPARPAGGGKMARWTAALAAAAAIAGAVPCAAQPVTGPGGEIEILLRMIASPDKKARKNAAKMLGGVRDRRAVDALIHALRDPKDDVRKEAAVSLGAAGDRRAVPALVAALNDGDGGVRTRAVDSLGDLGDPRAIRPLLGMLMEEQDPFRVTNIQRALKRIGALDRIAVRE